MFSCVKFVPCGVFSPSKPYRWMHVLCHHCGSRPASAYASFYILNDTVYIKFTIFCCRDEDRLSLAPNTKSGCCGPCAPRPPRDPRYLYFVILIYIVCIKFRVFPAAVVAVSGPARSGKSYFINNLASQGQTTSTHQSSGFTVGHTTNGVTKGIWVHSHVLNVTVGGVTTKVCTPCGARNAFPFFVRI